MTSAACSRPDIVGNAVLVNDSEAACRLVDELIGLTGEDPATVVTAALRERLARQRGLQDRLRRLRALAAEIRAGIEGPVSSADHNDLYEPDGLPI